ncbi:unnamed protein product [Amoebophrya sp. A120]|nr:unnamed protein product [Amoebophrya sp. A120]|eukprot:GSA120T00006009001.1
MPEGGDKSASELRELLHKKRNRVQESGDKLSTPAGSPPPHNSNVKMKNEGDDQVEEDIDKQERLLGSTPRAHKKRKLFDDVFSFSPEEEELRHDQNHPRRGWQEGLLETAEHDDFDFPPRGSGPLGGFGNNYGSADGESDMKENSVGKRSGALKNIPGLTKKNDAGPNEVQRDESDDADKSDDEEGLLEESHVLLSSPSGAAPLLEAEDLDDVELGSFLDPYPEFASPVTEFRVAISNRRVWSLGLENGERFDVTRNGTLVKDGGVTVTGKTLVLARGKSVVQTKVDTLVKAMRDAKGTPVRFKFTAAERKKLDAALGFATRKDDEEAQHWSKVEKAEEEFVWNDGDPKWQKVKVKGKVQARKAAQKTGKDREQMNRREGDKVFAAVYKTLHEKYGKNEVVQGGAAASSSKPQAKKSSSSSSNKLAEELQTGCSLVFSQAQFVEWFGNLDGNTQRAFANVAKAQFQPEKYQDAGGAEGENIFKLPGQQDEKQPFAAAPSEGHQKQAKGAKMPAAEAAMEQLNHGKKKNSRVQLRKEEKNIFGLEKKTKKQPILSDPNFPMENRAGSFRDPSMLGAVGAYFSADETRQHRCFTLSRDLLSLLGLGGSRGNTFFRRDTTLVNKTDVEEAKRFDKLALQVPGYQWDRGGDALHSASGFGVQGCILPIVRVAVTADPANKKTAAVLSFQIELINVGGQLLHELQAKMRFPCRSLRAKVSIAMEMETKFPKKAILQMADKKNSSSSSPFAKRDDQILKHAEDKMDTGEDEDDAGAEDDVNSSAYWIPSNDADVTPDQPPHWSKQHPLRPEQLRALGWLTRKERAVDHFRCVIPVFNAAADLVDTEGLKSSLENFTSEDDHKKPAAAQKNNAKKVKKEKQLQPMKKKNAAVAANKKNVADELFGLGAAGDEEEVEGNISKINPKKSVSKASSLQEPTSEEIGEKADNDPLEANWCAYSELEAEYLVRGGLLCDKPGHGKTATMIGVILNGIARPFGDAFEPDPGCFSAPETTLILVPKRLVRQWEEEFEKFCEPQFYRDHLRTRIRVIETADQFQKLTVKDIQNTWVLLMPFDVPFHKSLKERARDLGIGVGGQAEAQFTPNNCCMRLLRHATYLFQQHVAKSKNKKKKKPAKTEAELRFEEEDKELRARLRAYRKAREFQDKRHEEKDGQGYVDDFWKRDDGSMESYIVKEQVLNPNFYKNFYNNYNYYNPWGINRFYGGGYNYGGNANQQQQNQNQKKKEPPEPRYITRDVTKYRKKGRVVPENLRSDAANLEFPVLEQIKFGRIVFDEFHESESFKSREVHTLCNLQAHARFGLTGTPKQEDTRSIVAAASLFQVDFVGQDTADALMLNKIEYSSSKFLDLLKSKGEKEFSKTWSQDLKVDWRNVYAEKLDEYSFGEARHFGSKVFDADKVARFCNCCGQAAPRSSSPDGSTFFGGLDNPEFTCNFCGEKNHVAPTMLQVQDAGGAGASSALGGPRSGKSKKRPKEEDQVAMYKYKVQEREFLLQRAAFLSKHAWDRSAYFRKYAQEFVEHFMRQNSIKGVEDEIKIVEKVVRVVLKPEERVLYKNKEQSLAYALASSSAAEEKLVSVLEVEQFGLLDDEAEEEDVPNDDEGGAVGSGVLAKKNPNKAQVVQHNNHEKLAVRKGYLSAEDLKKRTALLKLCCHFQNKNDNAGSAKEQVAEVAEKKRQETELRKKEIHKILLKMLCYERAATFFRGVKLKRVTADLERISLDDVTAILNSALRIEQTSAGSSSSAGPNKKAKNKKDQQQSNKLPNSNSAVKEQHQPKKLSKEAEAFEALVQSAMDFWVTHDALDNLDLLGAAFGKHSYPPTKHLLQKVLRRDLMERHVERASMAAEDQALARGKSDASSSFKKKTEKQLRTEMDGNLKVIFDDYEEFVDGFWLEDEIRKKSRLAKARMEAARLQQKIAKAVWSGEDQQLVDFDDGTVIDVKDIARAQVARTCEAGIRDARGNFLDPNDMSIVDVSVDAGGGVNGKSKKKNNNNKSAGRRKNKNAGSALDLFVVDDSDDEEDEVLDPRDRAAGNWETLVGQLLTAKMEAKRGKEYAKGLAEFREFGAKLKEQLLKTGMEIRETMDAEFAFQRLCSVSEGNLNYFKSVMSSDLADAEEIECTICYDDFEPKNMLLIERCCHVFCDGCLRGALADRSKPQMCPTCRGPCSLDKTSNLEEVLRTYRVYEQKSGGKFGQLHQPPAKTSNALVVDSSATEREKEEDKRKMMLQQPGAAGASGAGAGSASSSSSSGQNQHGGGLLGRLMQNVPSLRGAGRSGSKNIKPWNKKLSWLEEESVNEEIEMESKWMQQVPRKDKHGSKLHYVAALLQKIFAEDQTAKVIIFSQFADLQAQVRHALDEYGRVNFATVNDRQGLQAFQKKLTPELVAELGPAALAEETRVLLLSLEKEASGLNLTSANHVFLLHPMCTETVDKACAFELQAMARVRRLGQVRKEVTMWRLVTADTVEQDLVLEHRQQIDARRKHKEEHAKKVAARELASKQKDKELQARVDAGTAKNQAAATGAMNGKELPADELLAGGSLPSRGASGKNEALFQHPEDEQDFLQEEEDLDVDMEDFMLHDQQSRAGNGKTNNSQNSFGFFGNKDKPGGLSSSSSSSSATGSSGVFGFGGSGASSSSGGSGAAASSSSAARGGVFSGSGRSFHLFGWSGTASGEEGEARPAQEPGGGPSSASTGAASFWFPRAGLFGGADRNNASSVRPVQQESEGPPEESGSADDFEDMEDDLLQDDQVWRPPPPAPPALPQQQNQGSSASSSSSSGLHVRNQDLQHLQQNPNDKSAGKNNPQDEPDGTAANREHDQDEVIELTSDENDRDLQVQDVDQEQQGGDAQAAGQQNLQVPDLVSSLVAMGFTRALAVEAARQNDSLPEAVDYCLAKKFE